MTDAAPVLRPRNTPSAFWSRAGLVVALLVITLVIWGGRIYLTRAFTEDQNADAMVRATLYAGSLQSAMQRHSVVPLLLSRDPVLITALTTGRFREADERLTTFREEIGAGALFLLDRDGRLVAASDDRPRGTDGSTETYFTLPTGDATNNTAFSITPNLETGGFSFQYSRRIEREGDLLGVIVVVVDLAPAEETWRRARVKVAATDSEGMVLLAAEPVWRGRMIDEVLASANTPTRMGAALNQARSTFGSTGYVYIAGVPHLEAEVTVGFRGWTLTYFPTLEGVRARVNGVVALVVTGIALLAALAFYLLSRRTRAESLRIQRESQELRLLNRRLSVEMATRRRIEKNLKEAEQSLEQASKLAALGQMSAAVSHELNQPLAAMKTYLAGARLLLQRRRPDEALSSFQRIDDLIDRMGGITRQLKSYARKGDVDLEPVDLRKSVRAALSMMAPQLGKMAVTITTTLPSEPAVVMADPLRIEQIIVNLLRNALDAIKGQEDRRIKIFLVLGETILLSIEDNGPGLADPTKLFEPFYTTKKPGEGLGLGLAISAGFAAELGGRLVAHNAPDGGAVFELLLPRDQTRSQTMPRAAE